VTPINGRRICSAIPRRFTRITIEGVEDRDPESSTLKVSFNRFGRGEQRRSNFVVEVNWLDVEGFLREFIELGHPEVLRHQRGIRLAEAIEQAGWAPDESSA
jgi:hypothetical protein